MAKKSVSSDLRDASDNTPMTIGEIATVVAKKKKGATKRRAIKTAAKKAGKKVRKTPKTA